MRSSLWSGRSVCRGHSSRILALVFSPVFASAVAGAVLDVPTQYPTISSAMGVAQPGDSVLVAPGFYLEAVSLPAGVTLLSTAGRDSTLIGPQDRQPALTFLSGSNGETVCRGFSLHQVDIWGAPPVVSGNSEAVIEDCSIWTGDNADTYWPMLYLGGGEIIRGCELNHHWNGSMFQTYAPNAEVLVEDCEILWGFTGDGGLCCQASSSTLMFRNNTFHSHFQVTFGVTNSTDFSYEFVDNIFYDRTLWLNPDLAAPDGVSFRHNVYWNCSFRDSPEDFFVGGFGNFGANPLFCEDPLNHWLEPESPCIGAGETGENIGARFGVCDVASVPEAPVSDFVRSNLQVWPNPSTGSVEIVLADDFDATDLDAAIFGIDGRRLATLRHGSQTGSMSWSGEVDGKAVPNGSYIVVLRRNGSVVATERFVLAR